MTDTNEPTMTMLERAQAWAKDGYADDDGTDAYDIAVGTYAQGMADAQRLIAKAIECRIAPSMPESQKQIMRDAVFVALHDSLWDPVVRS